jgi:hypothetical protein
MKWTLKHSGKNASELMLVSDDDRRVIFKYSSTQHSIRMRFKEHYGVYMLDEGGFSAKKCAIRNVYGSEIGNVIKGSWREAGGTVVLNEVPEKFSYEITTKDSTIKITTGTSAKDEVKITDATGNEDYLLALIVFSWMQSVTAVQAVTF